MSIKRLLVIVGPTGSGKTDLSIRLARRFGAPILSTDSRQFYRGMPIGTAQPSAEQLQAAEHHFIASHDITESLNCGEYETLALARLGELFATHDWVVAVGGSGLYVQALCDGMDDLPTADEALRAELMRRLREEGLERLAGELRELDPVYWETMDRRNPARVVRALEVCLQSGRPYSELRRGERRERPFRIVKVGVDLPRGTLYERIDRRVERMLADGLVDEARALYPFRELNALQRWVTGSCSTGSTAARATRRPSSGSSATRGAMPSGSSRGSGAILPSAGSPPTPTRRSSPGSAATACRRRSERLSAGGTPSRRKKYARPEFLMFGTPAASSCTRSGNRTRTAIAGHRILSPACLPVPPSEPLPSAGRRRQKYEIICDPPKSRMLYRVRPAADGERTELCFRGVSRQRFRCGRTRPAGVSGRNARCPPPCASAPCSCRTGRRNGP